MLGKKIKAKLALMLSLVLILSPICTYADTVSEDDLQNATIKGTVLKKGSDNEKSEITHKPINILNAGVDIEVKAMIKDNVSIIKSEIWVKNEENEKWTIVPMNRISGDHKEGEYLGVIPGKIIKSEKVQYQIKAQDFGGNVAETPIYDVQVKFGEKPDEYESDFSQYPNGWQLMGEWQWGEPEAGPKLPEGNKVLGTNLSGNYSDSTESTLIMPALDLRNTKQASIRLKHWYDTERRYDKGIVAISNDFGESWKNVGEYSGNEKKWEEMLIDLREYCGSENPVLVSFQLKSDRSGNYSGWYIDDVRFLGVDTEGPTAPTGLQVESGAKEINLTWAGVSEIDFSGYNVYRAKVGEDFELIGNTKFTEFTDRDYEKGQEYIYMVKAYDLVGNESESSNEQRLTTPAMSIIYENDFEDDIEGWNTGGENNTWQYGNPTFYRGPREIPSGEKLWGTDLIREYSSDSNCWLESPEIDLSGFGMVELNYKQWIWTEGWADFGFVKVSKDSGKTWTEIAKYKGENNQWKEEGISLNDYAGEKIKIRFLLTSDSCGNRPGWYIDDVEIWASEEKSSNNANQNENEAKIEKVIEIENKTKSQENIEAKDSEPVDSTVNIRLQKDSYDYVTADSNEENIISGIPVEAVVSIEETGESTKVGLVDGTFEMEHKPSQEGKAWTIKVEAYGYYTQEEKIELSAGEEVIKNFLMEDIPKGRIVGKLVDERTGEPIEGVNLKVVEDSNLPEVFTDVSGNFVIDNVLEDKYTIRISHDKYHMKEVSLDAAGNTDNDLSLKMKPFIGYKNEIAYDNGVEDETRALKKSGNSWLVRMTPENYAVLKGARFYVHSEEWPSPGNNKVSLIVFDSLPGGKPGEPVFETDIMEVKRGDWNYVDLSAYKFETDRDFYLGVTQIGDEPNCIGLGFDERGKFVKRTYQYLPKEGPNKFRRLGYEYGNAMIRADVSYLLKVPSIQYKAGKEYVNKEAITLSGDVSAGDSKVKIYVNGQEVKALETENKKYTVDVPLEEGENIITASGVIEAGETDKTEGIKVIRDTKLPEIVIKEPKEETVTGREVITVAGKIEDKNLKNIFINAKSVNFEEDGSFLKRVIVSHGENNITIAAEDKAGNSSTKTIKVNVNLSGPAIREMKPESEMAVKSGEKVKLSFKSDAQGAEAYFKVLGLNQVNADDEHKGRIKMEEVQPGYYEGTWTVPEKLIMKGAEVEFEIVDKVGNKTISAAPGRIYTIYDEIEPDSEYALKITDLNVKRNSERIIVESGIKNVKAFANSCVVIIKVTDENNRISNISTVEVPELIGGKSIKISSNFDLPEEGKYNVEAYVWDDLEHKTPLCNSQKTSFNIIKN